MFIRQTILKAGCWLLSSKDIVSIDQYADYVEIKVSSGDTHVIPISVFRHIVSGKLTVNRVSDFIPIFQEITKQWMQLKGLM